MNKIIIEHDIKTELDADVSFKNKLENGINNIILDVFDNTSLVLNIVNCDSGKYDIVINVYPNVTINLYEYIIGDYLKVRYKYNLETKSKVNVQKYYHLLGNNSLNIVYLNGMLAEFNYQFKALNVENSKNDLMIYHNSPKTISNITNEAINILNGSLNFNVTSIIKEKINGCEAIQNNHIINMNNNKCEINPILLIENDDVTASHSAFIGFFNKDELFYLMSRGINEKMATNLLMKGFLAKNLNEEFLKYINSDIDRFLEVKNE